MTALGVAPTLALIVGGVTFGFAGFAFALFASAGLALAWPPHVVIRPAPSALSCSAS